MLSERSYSCFFLGRGSGLGIQNWRCLPDNQGKTPKPRQFCCHSVCSICYRQVQKVFIWYTVILMCLVLPIFSSGLKTMVSARHLTFFLDLAPTYVFWTQTSARTPHWGSLFIILRRVITRDLSAGGFFYLPDMNCLKAFIWQSLRNSQLECCTPTSTHLQCLIPTAPIMMCRSGCWEYWLKHAEI